MMTRVSDTRGFEYGRCLSPGNIDCSGMNRQSWIWTFAKARERDRKVKQHQLLGNFDCSGVLYWEHRIGEITEWFGNTV